MNSFSDNTDRAEQIAELLRALAHPLRLRIIAVLSAGVNDNVTGLAQRLGVSQSFVSHHLRILHSKGFLVSMRSGSSVRYSLARPRLKELVDYLEGCPE